MPSYQNTIATNAGNVLINATNFSNTLTGINFGNDITGTKFHNAITATNFDNDLLLPILVMPFLPISLMSLPLSILVKSLLPQRNLSKSAYSLTGQCFHQN